MRMKVTTLLSLYNRSGVLPATCKTQVLRGAEAIVCMTNEWNRFNVFLDDGQVPIDNNPIEYDIGPFVVGRNGCSMTHRKKPLPVPSIYSLILTAKANGHEPYRYLRYLFGWLPTAG